LPPPKFVFADDGATGRRGEAHDSLVCPGAILSGGRALRSIVGSGVRVNSYARVEESILLDGVDVGRHARLRRTIVDKGVRIPSGMVIGFDSQTDAELGLTVSPAGVTVVPKGHRFASPQTQVAFNAGAQAPSLPHHPR
jgi:glucose-1-phosphate adenylyltransferase